MGFKPRNDRFGGRSGGFDGRREGGFGGNRGGRGGFGGNRFGDRGRSGDRGQMFSATCSKCGKECEVPFRPTGSKPVLCSDCFRQQPRDSPRGAERTFTAQAGSGITVDQFNKLNAKLDKILALLESLEIVEEDDFDEDEDEEDSDEE